MANELHNAAGLPEGFDEVKRLIEIDHIDVNAPDSIHHLKPVEYAASSGSLLTLRYLIEEAKATIDASLREKNLLALAKENPFPEVLEYIADPKNGLIPQFADGTTELHAAIYTRNIERIRELLSSAPHLLTIQNKDGESALSLAASMRRPSLVQTITSHPAFLSLDDPAKYDPVLQYQALQAEELAEHYKKHHKLEKAIESFQEAISTYRLMRHHDEKYPYHLGFCYSSLGECYYANYQMFFDPLLKQATERQAIDAFNQAIISLNASPIKNDDICTRLMNCHMGIGHFAYHSKHYDIAAGKYEEARRSFDGMEAKSLTTASQLQELQIDAERQLTMSREAEKWGFECEDVPGDGACFFHAALRQLERIDGFNPAFNSQGLRHYSLQHMRTHIDLYRDFMHAPPDRYFQQAVLRSTWADNLMIQAFSRKFNLTLVIINNDGTPPVIFKRPTPIATLYFGYQVDWHYKILNKVQDAVPTHSIQELIDTAPMDEWGVTERARLSAAELPQSADKKAKTETPPPTVRAADGSIGLAISSFFRLSAGTTPKPDAPSPPAPK